MKPFLWLDFDGVLRHWPDRLFDLNEDELSQVQAAAFAADLLTPAITGRITDEEWRAAIADRLSHSIGSPAAQGLTAKWSSPCGEIDFDLLAGLRELGLQGRLGLITNATSRLASDLERLGIAAEFTHIVNSSEFGAAKPSAEIFRHALSLSGHPALFADDSARNCEAAAAEGFTAHHFTGLSAFEVWLRSVLG
jgi:putative hydrolase of the HAD superfamily